MPPAIQIENLGKRYTVDHEAKQRGGYRTLRESLVDAASYPLRRLRGEGRPTREDFWALKDVSFEVQPGEVVGIIGRNGAGKSTLLKILSQITKPTTGRVLLNGRVGSLLEVGTGFHPELTGRENIYLNGSILGMSRQEIAKKFDEIVDFAEIEKFLDTPVKRYSSGMYVRLAFAVAAHLEPEILIVDEVLAVGDVAFQQKCLGTLRTVADSGRTVILVSHNLAAVENFTERGVVLEEGTIRFNGDTSQAIKYYQKKKSTLQHALLRDMPRASGRMPIIEAVRLSNADDPTESIYSGSRLKLSVQVGGEALPEWIDVGIGINDIHGSRLATIGTYFSNNRTLNVRDRGEVNCETAPLPLAPGTYSLKIAISSNAVVIDEIEDATTLVVEESDYYETGRMPNASQGKLLLKSMWSTEVPGRNTFPSSSLEHCETK